MMIKEKLKFPYLFILLFSLVTISCSDDNEDPPPVIKGGDFLSGGSWVIEQVVLEYTEDGSTWMQSAPAVNYAISFGGDSIATWKTTATFHDLVSDNFQTEQDPLFLQVGEYEGKWWWSEATNLPASLDVTNYHYGFLHLEEDYTIQTINTVAGDSMFVSHLGPKNQNNAQYRVHFLLLK